MNPQQIRFQSLYTGLCFIRDNHGANMPVRGANGMVPCLEAISALRKHCKSLGIKLKNKTGLFAESCHTPVQWEPKQKRRF